MTQMILDTLTEVWAEGFDWFDMPAILSITSMTDKRKTEPYSITSVLKI